MGRARAAEGGGVMAAYYNENDPFAAQWLRNLIAGGHIAPGDVDDRSITDVRPDDLRAYAQCHFFAGIGGWPYGLRLAGWGDDDAVWTGSCPCQPLSSAGRRRGAADDRHLWPAFCRLIAECRPSVVFGEQVASTLGRAWLAAVRLDLESLGYACGAADLPAAGIGAPHIRQRLWYVADAVRETRRSETRQSVGSNGDTATCGGTAESGRHGRAGLLADALFPGRPKGGTVARDGSATGGGCTGDVANASEPGLEIVREQHARPERKAAERGGAVGGPALGPWSDLEWLPCRDGKARPTEPGLFPLAHGIPGRVGRLRAYGNAIVPQVAAEFIGAYRDARVVAS